MFVELERLAEIYGVPTAKIPAFIGDLLVVTGLHAERSTHAGVPSVRYVTEWVAITAPPALMVEDYHGKVPQN